LEQEVAGERMRLENQRREDDERRKVEIARQAEAETKSADAVRRATEAELSAEDYYQKLKRAEAERADFGAKLPRLEKEVLEQGRQIEALLAERDRLAHDLDLTRSQLARQGAGEETTHAELDALNDRYRALVDELKRRDLKVDSLLNELKAREGELKAAESRLAEADNTQAGSRRTNDDLRARADERERAMARSQNEIRERKQELEKLTMEMIRAREEKESLGKKVEHLARWSEELEKKRAEMEKMIEGLADSNRILEIKVKEQERKLATTESEKSAEIEKLRTMQQMLVRSKTSLEERVKALQTEQEDKGARAREMAAMRELLAEHEADKKELKAAVQGADLERATLVQERALLRESVDTLQSQATKLKSERESALSDLRDSREALQSMRKRFEQAESDRQRLQVEIAPLEARARTAGAVESQSRELVAKSKELDTLRSELKRKETDVRALNIELTKTREDMRESDADVVRLNRKLEAANAAKATAESDLKDADETKKRFDAERKRSAKFEAELTLARHDAEAAKAEAARIGARLEELRRSAETQIVARKRAEDELVKSGDLHATEADLRVREQALESDQARLATREQELVAGNDRLRVVAERLKQKEVEVQEFLKEALMMEQQEATAAVREGRMSEGAAKAVQAKMGAYDKLASAFGFAAKDVMPPAGEGAEPGARAEGEGSTAGVGDFLFKESLQAKKPAPKGKGKKKGEDALAEAFLAGPKGAGPRTVRDEASMKKVEEMIGAAFSGRRAPAVPKQAADVTAPGPGANSVAKDYVDSLVYDYEKKIDFLKLALEEERVRRQAAEDRLISQVPFRKK
ncbi:MAG TPA: hypothetical protein VI893_02255, partial [Thermoplasmata archaeon]|nr:hypothetical protein [Thermoplasmata archaeon]